MSKQIRFWSEDHGAVAIDWVAVSAGILLLGVAVVYGIMQNLATMTTGMNGVLTNAGSILVNPVNAPSDLTFTASVPDSDPVEVTESDGGSDDDDDSAAVDNGEDSGGDDSPLAGLTVCNSGGICYVDTDGDGNADQRTDGGNTFNEPSGPVMSALESSGFIRQ